MYILFLLFCIIGNVVEADDDSSEAKYIDLLPEEEKRQFIETIARRILEEVKAENETAVAEQSREISEDQLNVQNEYVSKLLREETQNLRRKNDEKATDTSIKRDSRSSDDDFLKVKTLEKDEMSSNENNRKDNIDLTLQKGKIGKINKSDKTTTTTEKVVSTVESATKIISKSTTEVIAVLVKSNSVATEKKNPKNISIEISVEDDSTDNWKNDTVTTEINKATHRIMPEIHTIPVKIMYDPSIEANLTKNMNKQNKNTNTSTEVTLKSSDTTVLESNSKPEKESLRKNNSKEDGASDSVTQVEDFSPEVVSDSIEESGVTTTNEEAEIEKGVSTIAAKVEDHITTTTEAEVWGYTAEILEPIGYYHTDNIDINQTDTSIESKIEEKSVEDPPKSKKFDKLKNDLGNNQNDSYFEAKIVENPVEGPADSTKVDESNNNPGNNENNSYIEVKIEEKPVENSHSTEVEESKNITENNQNTYIIEARLEEQSLKVPPNSKKVEKSMKILDNNQNDSSLETEIDEKLVEDRVSSTEVYDNSDEKQNLRKTKDEVSKDDKTIAKETTSFHDDEILTTTEVEPSISKNNTITTVHINDTTTEETTSANNEEIFTTAEANTSSTALSTKDNVVISTERSSKSQPTEERGFVQEPKYETQIENSKLFNNLKSKYDKKKEYIVYEIEPGDSRFVKFQPSKPEHTLKQAALKTKETVSQKLDSNNKKSEHKSLRSLDENENMSGPPHYIPIHNYAPEHAYFNPHNRFAINPDNVNQKEEDINKEISINLSKEDSAFEELPLKKLRSSNGNENINESPYYIPVHNYAPENAYFNPHNRFGPNADDSSAMDAREGNLNNNINLSKENLAQDEFEFRSVHKNTQSEENRSEKQRFRPQKYIPVYKYALKNAYYNPHKNSGTNSDDSRAVEQSEDDSSDKVFYLREPKDSLAFDEKFKDETFRMKDTDDLFKAILNMRSKENTKKRLRFRKEQKRNNTRPEFRHKKTNSVFKPVDYLDMDYFFGRKKHYDDKLWSDADLDDSKYFRGRKERKELDMPDSDDPEHPFNSKHKQVLEDPTAWAREVLYKQHYFGLRTKYTTIIPHDDDYDEATKPITTKKSKKRKTTPAHFILRSKNEENEQADLIKKIIFNHKPLRDDPKGYSTLFTMIPKQKKDIMPYIPRARPKKMLISENDKTAQKPHSFDSEEIKVIFNMSETIDLLPLIHKLQNMSLLQKYETEDNTNNASYLLRVNSNNLSSYLKPRTATKLKFNPDKPKLVLTPQMSDYLSLLLKSSQQKSLEKADSKDLEAYVNVLRDMVKSENQALKQYNWLGTTVDVRSAINKLSKLIEDLQNRELLHPSDLQLLKYLLYLHDYSKNTIKNNYMGKTGKVFVSLKPSHLQRNLKDEIMKSKDMGNRRWLMEAMYKADDEFEDQLESFDEFLIDMQLGLKDLHDAIKHIAMITTFKNQKWYENLMNLYLKDASKPKLLQVIIHLITTRLFSLVEKSAVNGLEDDYVKYMEENALEISRTKDEFILVLKLLNELKNS